MANNANKDSPNQLSIDEKKFEKLRKSVNENNKEDTAKFKELDDRISELRIGNLAAPSLEEPKSGTKIKKIVLAKDASNETLVQSINSMHEDLATQIEETRADLAAQQSSIDELKTQLQKINTQGSGPTEHDLVKQLKTINNGVEDAHSRLIMGELAKLQDRLEKELIKLELKFKGM